MLHVARDTKTGTRPVPINETAQAILKERSRHRFRSPYVFTDDEGESFDSGKRRNDLTKLATADMRGAGIADATFKTLRTTAGSWMVQRGVGLHRVQKILGHSTPVITEQFYAHLSPENLREGTSALDDAIRGMDTSHSEDRRTEAGADA